MRVEDSRQVLGLDRHHLGGGRVVGRGRARCADAAVGSGHLAPGERGDLFGGDGSSAKQARGVVPGADDRRLDADGAPAAVEHDVPTAVEHVAELGQDVVDRRRADMSVAVGRWSGEAVTELRAAPRGSAGVPVRGGQRSVGLR